MLPPQAAASSAKATLRLAFSARQHTTSAAPHPLSSQPGPSRSASAPPQGSSTQASTPRRLLLLSHVRHAHRKASHSAVKEQSMQHPPPTTTDALAQSYNLVSQQLALQRQDSEQADESSTPSGEEQEEEEEAYDVVTSQQRLIRGMAALHGTTTSSLDDVATRLGGIGFSLESHESSSRTAAGTSTRLDAPHGTSPRPRLAPYNSPSSSSAAKAPQRRKLHSTSRRGGGGGGGGDIDLSFPRHANPTPYDIFHLDEGATASEVKRRYYDLVRHLHPDRRLGGGTTRADKARKTATTKATSSKSQEEATIKANDDFKSVLAAYEILKDGTKRAAYDRYGVGWGQGTSSGGFGGFGGTGMKPPPGWGGGAGGAGGMPRTKSEWEAYHAWSDMLRRTASGAGSGPSRSGWEHRGAAKGHDAFGWQSYAANPQSSEAFYGFYTSNRQEGASSSNGPRQQPLYTTNLRFIGFLFLATWTVASIQYVRLSAQSAKAVERADRKHMDAARSLDEARELARSKEGRKRWEEMRRRAREVRIIEAVQGNVVEDGDGLRVDGGLRAIDAPAIKAVSLEAADGSPWGIGHGGPSGKEAYEAREAERKRREDNRTGRA